MAEENKDINPAKFDKAFMAGMANAMKGEQGEQGEHVAQRVTRETPAHRGPRAPTAKTGVTVKTERMDATVNPQQKVRTSLHQRMLSQWLRHSTKMFDLKSWRMFVPL
jgi:hypothetical protein